MNIEKISLKKRKPLTEEELNILKEKLYQEELKPYELEKYHSSIFLSRRNILAYYRETNPQEELFKRYEYLYKNKDLILSLCIKDAIDYEDIKESIKDLKKVLKNYIINNDEKILLDTYLKNYKDILSGEKLEYYLFSKVDDEIVDAYEEFLFTTNNIEDTVLYRHIEAVKNNPMYLTSIEDAIHKVEERRKYYNQINGNETFTVWKILTYVREKNITNPKVLKALDKYYNLDRYITTGLNLKSGFEFLEEDIDIIDDNITSEDYQERIKLGNIIYDITYAYKKLNKFEDEDEYYISNIKYANMQCNSLYKTIFMRDLAELSHIEEEDKQELRNKLIKKSKGMTKY